MIGWVGGGGGCRGGGTVFLQELMHVVGVQRGWLHAHGALKTKQCQDRTNSKHSRMVHSGAKGHTFSPIIACYPREGAHAYMCHVVLLHEGSCPLIAVVLRVLIWHVMPQKPAHNGELAAGYAPNAASHVYMCHVVLLLEGSCPVLDALLAADLQLCYHQLLRVLRGERVRC